jgi:hypothetical protein
MVRLDPMPGRSLIARALLAGLVTLPGSAGVIQGVVLEHSSGRPVARTIVRLDAVPSPGGVENQPVVLRSGRSGQFTFGGIAPGRYILTALRDGYFPVSYGQRRAVGRGTPIEVTADSTFFAELRIRQKGAITGRVLDENGVAAKRVPVLAYRARLPLRSAGSGMSDDRGVYRIAGLEPGKYWVRSAPHILDDGTGWLPTYSPQGRETKDARVYTVAPDADAAYADVSPEPGPLFRLGGLITCEASASVVVTAFSESGVRTAQTFCGPSPGAYRFDGLAAGAYEVFAEVQGGSAAGFLELVLGGNMEGANITLTKTPPVTVEVRRTGSRSPADIAVTLTGRRQNLAETGTDIDVVSRKTALSPGYWEFRAVPAPGYFVESIAGLYGTGRRRARPERPPDRFEVFIEPRYQSELVVTLSDRVARIGGRVLSDGKPVPGAPVFLWPVDGATRRSTAGSLQTLSNMDGQYRFENLPPGEYRILASFDVYEFDEDLVELSRAAAVTAEALAAAEVDLPVWTAPW